MSFSCDYFKKSLKSGLKSIKLVYYFFLINKNIAIWTVDATFLGRAMGFIKSVVKCINAENKK